MRSSTARWLLAGIILLLFTIPGWAATFDIADGDVTALINAINEANGNGKADTINLANGGTHTLTAVDNDTNGPNGLPSITSEITIDGNGATIQRSSAGGTPDFRIFHVAAGGDLTINDLTITNGNSGDGNGGGILNEGALTLENCTVSGNTADECGGGILWDGGLRGEVSLEGFAAHEGDDGAGCIV